MKIIKSKQYEKDFKKKIKAKHKQQEIETIQNIEELIIDSKDLKSLLLNPVSTIYGIRQKESNLKKLFTADVNKKIRLYLKPIGEYPYNQIEITEIEFLHIDDKHYGDG